jgi:amino acid transporter
MSQDYKLSLPAAVLININIMLGVGIFMNTALLAKETGALGFINYILVAILLLPLVLSVAKLLELHPSGGFYTFAKQEINTFSGFMSSWIYFTGKLASCTIMIHTSVCIFQKSFPTLATLSPFALDAALLSLFIALNMFNIKAGRNIQVMFTTFKAIPVLFVIAAGFYLFNGDNFSSSNLIWEGIPTTLPLVIYALMGFEAAASLSSKIKDAHKNAPRAVLISYGIILCILTVYQLLFYSALGSTLGLATYREAFPGLLNLLLPDNLLIANKLGGLINIAIASSALGGAYGILFSNSWNLHVLAQNNHILASSTFAKLNRHFIPFACVLAEGFLCITYLILTQGNQVLLQSIGALAAVTCYTLSALALVRAKYKRPEISINRIVPILGVINCLILATACIYGLVTKGATSLYGFIGLILIGSTMYYLTSRRRKAL